MPFFRVDSAGALHVSPQIWIYIVVATPVTAVTLLSWRWERQRRTKRRMQGLDQPTTDQGQDLSV